MYQGAPRGSVIGPLIFNIYLNDLFYLTESTEVCNSADNTTFFACDNDQNKLFDKKRLQCDSLLAFEWSQNNNMKLNQNECHLLVTGYKHEIVWAQIGDKII